MLICDMLSEFIFIESDFFRSLDIVFEDYIDRKKMSCIHDI